MSTSIAVLFMFPLQLFSALRGVWGVLEENGFCLGLIWLSCQSSWFPISGIKRILLFGTESFWKNQLMREWTRGWLSISLGDNSETITLQLDVSALRQLILLHSFYFANAMSRQYPVVALMCWQWLFSKELAPIARLGFLTTRLRRPVLACFMPEHKQFGTFRGVPAVSH